MPRPTVAIALNEDRGLLPGDGGNAAPRRSPPASLNEDRGLLPGDGSCAAGLPSAWTFAQRRPGIAPR